MMSEQEIREKLKRLKDDRLQNDDWFTGYGWLLAELERQLDLNTQAPAMRELLERVDDMMTAMKRNPSVMPAYELIHADIKTLLGEKDADV